MVEQLLGQQAELLAEDTARAVGGAAEKASRGETQQGGATLDGQVLGGADVAAVDLAGRLGAQGTKGGRGSGAQAKGDSLDSDLDVVEAEPGIGQQQWEQPREPPWE